MEVAAVPAPTAITDSLRFWLSSASLAAGVWSAFESASASRCLFVLAALICAVLAIAAFVLPTLLLLRHRLPIRGNRASMLLVALALAVALCQVGMIGTLA
jgi:hypothetical protein